MKNVTYNKTMRYVNSTIDDLIVTSDETRSVQQSNKEGRRVIREVGG